MSVKRYVLEKNVGLRHPFHIRDITGTRRSLSDFLNFWQKKSNEFRTIYICIMHSSFHMFALYLVNEKTSFASKRTLRHLPLSVRLFIEPKSHNFCKSLFELLTFKFLPENVSYLQVNPLAAKLLNL